MPEPGRGAERACGDGKHFNAAKCVGAAPEAPAANHALTARAAGVRACSASEPWAVRAAAGSAAARVAGLGAQSVPSDRGLFHLVRPSLPGFQRRPGRLFRGRTLPLPASLRVLGAVLARRQSPQLLGWHVSTQTLSSRLMFVCAFPLSLDGTRLRVP